MRTAFSKSSAISRRLIRVYFTTLFHVRSIIAVRERYPIETVGRTEKGGQPRGQSQSVSESSTDTSLIFEPPPDVERDIYHSRVKPDA